MKMTRDIIQHNAKELIKANDRVLLQWCTGLGKSKAALEAAWELFQLKGESVKILLVVAELAHIDNWKEEVKKWNMFPLIEEDMITITTYASLKNFRDTEQDMTIYDEGHHIGSDLRLDIASSIKSEKILVLTATMPEQSIQDLIAHFGEFVSYKIPLKDAIAWGVLPAPEVYIIPITLDYTYPIHTVVEERGITSKRVSITCEMKDIWVYLKDKVKYPNLTLTVKCTAYEKYKWLDNKYEYWKKTYMRRRNDAIKNKWLQQGLMRKRFLGELKDSEAQFVLTKIKDKRFVCFCSSVEQAIKLGGDNAIHSGRPDSLEVIKKFNDKQINSLFAVGMIQEGQNLTDIEAGLLIQLDGQERGFVQKSGRAMRATVPELYILYVKNTKDEDYLMNVYENIDKEHIMEFKNIHEWHDSIN